MTLALLADEQDFQRLAVGERELQASEQFEIAFAAHTGCSEQVLDDDDGDRAVHRNQQRALHTGLHLDAVVAFLAAESETVLFEYADEIVAGYWP